MAEKATLARPYARAAFAHAQSAGALPAWSQLLATSAAVVRDGRVSRLIGDPRVSDDEVVELIAGIAKADEKGKNFLHALAENGRLPVLPEISAQYEVLRAEVENVVDVELVSAREVGKAQQERLAAALTKRLGREVRMHTRIDESLIGGAIVRAGDLVIDGSLKGRIERLGAAVTN